MQAILIHRMQPATNSGCRRILPCCFNTPKCPEGELYSTHDVPGIDSVSRPHAPGETASSIHRKIHSDREWWTSSCRPSVIGNISEDKHKKLADVQF